MKITNYTLIILSFLLVSCSSKKNMEKQLLGKWMMNAVYENDQNVTSKHNPENNRWIKFNRNGSYESGGDPHGYNDGEWELDVEKAILFLDSNMEDDDSEWKISFKDDKTIWTGIGTPRQEGVKLVLKKEK